MNSFEEILGRLKLEMRLTADQEVAAAFRMSKEAFSTRKKRDRFPVDKLKSLAFDQPEIGIDVQFVLTGVRNKSERLKGECPSCGARALRLVVAEMPSGTRIELLMTCETVNNGCGTVRNLFVRIDEMPQVDA
jgi:hypothetical protein